MSICLPNSNRQASQLLLLSVFFLCTALGVICFAESLYYPFLDWDDPGYILKDPATQVLNLQSLIDICCSYYQAAWYPVTRSSHALDIWLFGHDAFYHRTVSLFIHILNGTLVYLLAQRVLQLALPTADKTLVIIAALTAALLFIVHPQHVEVVAWLTQRNDLLATVFFLLCLIQYCDYLSSQQEPSKKESGHKKHYYYYTLLFAALAMAAKSTAVGLPLILLIFDLLFNKQKFRIAALEKLPFIVASVAIAYVSFAAHDNSYSMKLHELYTLNQRICYAAYNMLDFMYRFFISTNLTPLVAMPDWIQTRSPRALLPLICVLLIVTLCGLRLFRQRHNILALLVLGYLALILPVSGLLMHGTYSPGNRYMYLPSTLLLVFLALAFYKLLARLPAAKKFYAVIPVLLVISLLTVLSRTQLKHWQDDLSLWQYVAEQQPRSATALSYLALQQYSHHQISLKQSADKIEKAVAIEPVYVGLSNLLLIYEALDDLKMLLHTHARLAYYYPQSSGSSLAFLGIYELSRGHADKATDLILSGIKTNTSLCEQIETQYPNSPELKKIIQQARAERWCNAD